MVRWPAALLLLAGLALLGGCGGDPAGPGAGARDAALIEAARRGDTGEVRRRLDEGAAVSARDPGGATALVAAAYGNHLESARALVAAGADVNAEDSYNGTGLIRAAERGHAEVVRRLLATPIEVDHVNRLGWTALLEAVILGQGGPDHTRTVRVLVDAGADVNLPDGDGVTPLAHARQRGQRQIAGILRDAGARS